MRKLDRCLASLACQMLATDGTRVIVDFIRLLGVACEKSEISDAKVLPGVVVGLYLPGLMWLARYQLGWSPPGRPERYPLMASLLVVTGIGPSERGSRVAPQWDCQPDLSPPWPEIAACLGPP